jgi:hypothetical protein
VLPKKQNQTNAILEYSNEATIGTLKIKRVSTARNTSTKKINVIGMTAISVIFSVIALISLSILLDLFKSNNILLSHVTGFIKCKKIILLLL